MKKSPKMIYYFIILSITLFVIIFLNLGRYLDVAQKPVLSDIIVCLGGGGKDRVEKSIELYRIDKGMQKKEN